MKRSEMLEIIERRLLSWDDHCTRNFSDLILEDIEKAGMTPPRYTALMRNGEKYDKDKHFGADVIDRVGWEPEDE